MADTNSHFHIRPASLDGDDAVFILAAWDSTLPFLTSIGAGEMWGHQPFSQREGQKQEIIDIITEMTKVHDGGRQFWIAETGGVVRVGAAMTRDALPGYLTEHVDLKKHLDASKKLLYLEVLITDHRHNKRSRGAGKALIEVLKQHAQSNGRDVIYVDVWAGNDRKLNMYYEDIGFTKVADFCLERRNKSSWPGLETVLENLARALLATNISRIWMPANAPGWVP